MWVLYRLCSKSPAFARGFGKWRSRIQCYSPKSKSHLARNLLAYHSKIISPFHIILLILRLTLSVFHVIGICLLLYRLNNTSRIPNPTRMYILVCKHVVTTISRVNAITEIRASSKNPGTLRSHNARISAARLLSNVAIRTIANGRTILCNIELYLHVSTILSFKFNWEITISNSNLTRVLIEPQRTCTVWLSTSN